MFKDTEKELRRLEAELLAQEPQQDKTDEDALLEDILEEYGSHKEQSQQSSLEYTQVYQGVRVYNNDSVEQDPEELSQELLEEPKEKGVLALAITAGVLTVAILCTIVWWIARYGEAFL